MAKQAKQPSLATLERWLNDGLGKAIDGCSGIEADGNCPHGKPSWIKFLGF